ncbi:hypothetical protein L248_0794 [Schleiferilactobacillus shenzhenensis LY-73]|uniref:Gram-positive pilin subunit D1 N-terminal domain-containing protein n=1 Tax=Schleiferilactobacillus shenzhenensis LY-73 TaxID=1231336 RepID=U4TMG0_9LACO|nr:hypothetical protein L248_0794 [Schleiferilactobacillus shenzhenensis LY-73]
MLGLMLLWPPVSARADTVGAADASSSTSSVPAADESSTSASAAASAQTTDTAATTAALSLHIQKYQLSAGVASVIAKQAGTKLSLPDDVQPGSGVHYRVQRVLPTRAGVAPTAKQSSSYKLDDFDRTITTDDSGSAVLTSADGLVPGYYLVTEVADDAVPEPMAPVIVQLPLPNAVSGGVLRDVYLYPKSGLVSPKVPSTHGSSNFPPEPYHPYSNFPKTPQTLAQTSGVLDGQGWVTAIVVLLVLGSMIIIWPVRLFHRR